MRVEEFSLAPGGKLNLVPGMKDGAQYLPVFSSPPRMQEYVSRRANISASTAATLLELTRGAPVILNPASEYGKELRPTKSGSCWMAGAESAHLEGEPTIPWRWWKP